MSEPRNLAFLLSTRQIGYTGQETAQILGPVFSQLEELHQAGKYHGNVSEHTVYLSDDGGSELALSSRPPDLTDRAQTRKDLAACGRLMLLLTTGSDALADQPELARQRLSDLGCEPRFCQSVFHALSGTLSSPGQLMEGLFPQYQAKPPYQLPSSQPKQPQPKKPEPKKPEPEKPAPKQPQPKKPEPKKPEPKQPEPKGKKRLPKALLLLPVLVAAYFLLTVKVDPVVNYPMYDAQEMLEQIGISSRLETVYSSVTPGLVVDQSGVGRIPRWETVVLYVSKGNSVFVPQLAGMEQQLAIERAEELNLVPTVETVYCGNGDEHFDQLCYSLADDPTGLVVSQSLSPNSEVDSGTTLNLVVCGGVVLELPDFTGLSMGEVTATIEDLALSAEMSILLEQSPTHLPGTVLDQYPEANQSFYPGSQLVLTLSCPLFYNLPAEEARDALDAMGFRYTEEYAPSSQTEKGHVISAQLDAGDQSAHLIICQGPDSFYAPDLTGMSLPAAQELADSMGFTLTEGFSNYYYSSYSPDVIAYQMTPPGTEMKPGDSIIYHTSLGTPPGSSYSLSVDRTEISLSPGQSASILLSTQISGGCIANGPSCINVTWGEWMLGQPFSAYLEASGTAQPGDRWLVQFYIYSGSTDDGTDVVQDFVNVYVTIVP